MEVVVVPAIAAADSKSMMGESAGDRSSNLNLTSSFTIRGFVSHVRRQDIRKTWPFSDALLQRYLAEGKTLPHLDVPVSFSCGADGTAVECEVEGGGNLDTRQELELQLELEQHQEDGIDKNKTQDVSIDGKPDDDEQALEALQQLRVAEQSFVKADENTELVEPQNGEKDGTGTGTEGKASDTSDVGAAPQPDACLGGDNETVGAEAAAEADKGEAQVQQQNVCPVCTSFSCHSVTALNAHMDGCLSTSAAADKNSKLRGNKTSKAQKMRSITDIIAADPLPSPRQSDSVKPADSTMVRERRAPNNVVLLEDKPGAEEPLERPLRNLRSRSRGSGSMPSPRLETERSTRRRRRENNQKSGEWSERRKRHYSGNSVEVTSSWTPSISSGTYGHSKVQQETLLEKSSPEGDKPSESHGSANCLGSVQPVPDAEVDLSSKLDRAERSSCTTSMEDQKQHHEVQAPPEAEHVQEAPRCASPGPGAELVTEHQVSDQEQKQEQVKGPCEPTEDPSQQVAAKAVDVQPPTPSVSGPSTARVSESLPALRADETEAPAQGIHRIIPDIPQPPRSLIPVYDSVISSLRSCNVVDAVTGYRQVSSTWKAAVVMATLGASLVQSTGDCNPVPKPSTATANKNDTSVVQGTSRSPSSTPASDSVCVSVAENPNHVESLHHDGASSAPDYKTSAERGYISSDKHLYAGTGGRIGLEIPRFGAQGFVHASEPVQIISGSSCHLKPAGAKVPAVSWMVNSGERLPVIDVEQDLALKTADGKVEKPVLRLLGQNVMVPDSSAEHTSYAPKTTYAYPVSAANKDGSGHHLPCCCAKPPVTEQLTYSIAKSLPPSGKAACLPQIPIGGGTWRLVPNGFINQLSGQQVSFQAAPDPRKMSSSHHVRGSACCAHKSCGPSVARPSSEQENNASLRNTVSKHAGDLPPWLLAAKKQKEAEFAANVIVIDDDEPDDGKAGCFMPSASPTTRTLISTNGDVQCTGERLVRTSSHHPVDMGRTTLPACTFPAGASRKREAAEWNCQQQVDKAAKMAGTDSPSGRMGIPVLVPTWMITPSNNTAAAAQAAAAAKRGSTAQTYKARIAMMKAYMHGGCVNEAGQVVGGVVSSSPQQLHQLQHHHQRALVGNALLQPNCVYQVQQQVPRYGTGDMNAQQQHQHQQQLLFAPGKDCQLIELDSGEFILMNTAHVEAETQVPRIVGETALQIDPTAAAAAAAAAASTSYSHGAKTPTTMFRDGTGRNYIICSDQERRAAVAAEQFLMTPILQPGGSIVIGDAQTQVIPVYHDPSRAYLSAAAAAPSGAKAMLAPGATLAFEQRAFSQQKHGGGLAS